MNTTNCQHSAVFQDDDEVRCRECSRTVSYLAPPIRYSYLGSGKPFAEDDDTANRQEGVRPRLRCLACRQRGDLHGDVVKCRRCEATLAVKGEDGALHSPPFTPPRYLACSCCHFVLPQFSFNFNKKAVNRESRDYYCRACGAFRQRVRREQQGDYMQSESRRRAEAVKRKREAGELPPLEMTAERREAVNAAGRRYRARQTGRAVPKQRPGRPVIHFKPICRIGASCPLRSYCS